MRSPSTRAGPDEGGQPFVFGSLVGARVARVRDAVVVAVEQRAAVRDRVARADALHVGARVLVVEDGVAVAIDARAAVGLRIVREDSSHVGARVLHVDDAVAIAIHGKHGFGGGRRARAEAEGEAEREHVRVLRLEAGAELEDLRVSCIRTEIEAPAADAEVPADVRVEARPHHVSGGGDAAVCVDPQAAGLLRERAHAHAQHRTEAEAGPLRRDRRIRRRRARREDGAGELRLQSDWLRDRELEGERGLAAEAELRFLRRADRVRETERAVHAQVVERGRRGREGQERGNEPAGRTHSVRQVTATSAPD